MLTNFVVWITSDLSIEKVRAFKYRKTMLSATPLLRSAASFARINIKRNIGVSYVALKPAAAAIDPIQKLFAEKVSNSMFETIFTILCLNNNTYNHKLYVYLWILDKGICSKETSIWRKVSRRHERNRSRTTGRIRQSSRGIWWRSRSWHESLS